MGRVHRLLLYPAHLRQPRPHLSTLPPIPWRLLSPPKHIFPRTRRRRLPIRCGNFNKYQRFTRLIRPRTLPTCRRLRTTIRQTPSPPRRRLLRLQLYRSATTGYKTA
jgi:hypothetical protein